MHTFLPLTTFIFFVLLFVPLCICFCISFTFAVVAGGKKLLLPLQLHLVLWGQQVLLKPKARACCTLKPPPTLPYTPRTSYISYISLGRPVFGGCILPFSALHEAARRAAKEEAAAEAAWQLHLGKLRISGHIKHISTAHNKGGQQYVFWIILIGARRDEKKGEKQKKKKQQRQRHNKKYFLYGQFSVKWTKSRSKHVELITSGN